MSNTSLKEIMKELFAGNDLNQDSCRVLFSSMLDGELTDIEISAVLMALKVKGETGVEIASLVTLLRERAEPINAPEGLTADCAGTGGDGLGTFNVSTAAAITASACGLTMVKHGNRASSSPSGSADIIELSGWDLGMSAEQIVSVLEKNGFAFLFAPAFHPLVGRVMPVRKTLATSTIFNLAGPLANPLAPQVQLMGVCDESLLAPMAEVLQLIGCKKGLVVYGAGLDEVAIHDATKAIYVTPDEIKPLDISIEDFGISSHDLSTIQLLAQDPKAVFDDVINGTADTAKIDMVAINTGTLIWLSGLADSLEQGASMARDALKSGRVAEKLNSIINDVKTIVAVKDE